MNPYLKKYGFQPPKVTQLPSPALGICVVIPCHNEPNLLTTLRSLEQCAQPNCEVTVIVVVNQSEIAEENIAQQNNITLDEFHAFIQEPRLKYRYHVIEEMALPKKHAGVGLARKIGMDEAVHLFHQIEKDGIIVALDADCLVEPNYLTEIESHFLAHPKSPGCSIRYAHPLDNEKEELTQGIIQYELHLRYYNQALRLCGLPYAFHTVGSSMAVRSSAYQKQGGMNKRKAGEDFYFLQKIIELGNFTELNSTCVIPSPRVSDRVPFGTGKAMGDYLQVASQDLLTYDYQVFKELAEIPAWLTPLFEGKKMSHSNPVVTTFLEGINFENKIQEIRNNTTHLNSFIKRFYGYFNAFTVIKFAHYLRDNGLPNKPVESESKKLLAEMHNLETPNKSTKELLLIYREIERINA